MAPNVEFQGMDTIVGVLRNISENASPVLATRAFAVLTDVFNESQRLVPVRHGTLKGSGHISGPDANGEGFDMSIGYGGAAAEYAVWVHENLQARHKPPTQAKFLEQPFTQAMPRFRAIGDGFEEAMLRQYPQSPAIAHNAEMVAETKQNLGPRTAAASRRSRAFSQDDIHAALQRAAQQRGRMIRKR